MAHVSRKKEFIQADIETLLRAWMRKRPWEVRDVMDEADRIRAGLYRAKGMSREKLFMIKRVMSEGLNAAMGAWFGRHWQDDPDVVTVFDSVCKNFLINTTSVPKLGDKPRFMDGPVEDQYDVLVAEQIMSERDAK